MNTIVEDYKSLVADWPISRALMLLHVMGGYDMDGVCLLSYNGCRSYTVRAVMKELHAKLAQVQDARERLEFMGGPLGCDWFVGTFATFLVDRILRVRTTRGTRYLEHAVQTCDLAEITKRSVNKAVAYSS